MVTTLFVNHTPDQGRVKHVSFNYVRIPAIIPKNNKRAVNRRARQNKAPISKPSQIATSVVSAKIFRFYGANQAIITRSNMLGLLAVSLNGSSTFGGLISAIRIKHIKMWGVAGTSIQGIGLLWKGGQGKDVLLNDVSTSTAYPPFISSSPPMMSTASFWSSVDSSNLTEPLFELNPTGEEGGSPVSIVDVSCEFVLQNTSHSIIIGGTSITSGQLVYGYLDGPGGSSSYVPIGGIAFE